MEAFSGEAGWDGLAHSSVSVATAGWTNLSALFSDPAGLNSTRGGGSYFWLVPENSSVSPPQLTPQPQVRDLALARAEIGVLGMVLALATLGNSFVLWVLLRRRKHNAPMHLFMVNLCVADLVVAFFQVLPQLVWDITGRFQGPDVLCRSVKYLQIVGMFASSYMIVAMTVDRHHAICCPLQAYRGGAMSRWNTPVMVAWGLALLLSVPQVFIFSRSEVSPGEFECWGHFAEPWGLKAYVTWMTLAVFVLPAFIITVCQVRIFKEIHDNIYLKSERVVSADMKKSVVLFRFHSIKKEDDRARERRRESCGPREGRGRHPPKNSNGNPARSHCNAYNSQNAAHPAHPDCYDYPSQYSHGPSDLTSQPNSYSTNSPDILPPNHTPTNQESSSPVGADFSQGQLPLAAADSDCYQASPGYYDSFGKPLNPAYEPPTDEPPADVPHADEPPADVPRASPYPSPLTLVPPPPPSVSRAMSKTVRMTLVIVLVYTVCWSPFFIVQLWAAWDPNPPDQGVAFTILMLLASLNSCTNPWIYTAFSSSVSRELQALLCCRGRPLRRGSLPDDSTTTHTSTTKDGMY